MITNKKEKITIVDDNDKVIGYKKRGSLNSEDIYRVSALWLTNSKGQILLAKRHRKKRHHPGMWGPAVAGTNAWDESYKDNIIRETAEELGIYGIDPQFGPKIKTDNEFHHFTQWFTLELDKGIGRFTIQEDEVEKLEWFSPGEIKEGLKDRPAEFLPNMDRYLSLFVS